MDHYPLYLRNPLEDFEGRDLQVRTWSFDDAMALVVSPGLFVGGVVAMPVAGVVAPPWQKQHSRSVFDMQQPSYVIEYAEPTAPSP